MTESEEARGRRQRKAMENGDRKISRCDGGRRRKEGDDESLYSGGVKVTIRQQDEF